MAVLSNIGEIIPCEVKWQKSNRKSTDTLFSFLYLCNVLIFFGMGIFFATNSKGGAEWIQDGVVEDEEGGSYPNFIRNPAYQEEFESCCAGIPEDELSEYSDCQNIRTRHLDTSQHAKLSKGAGMFDALMAVPQVPFTLVSMVVFLSVLWVALLKKFAKTIIFSVEFVKFFVLAWMGTKTENPIFFVFAAVYAGFSLWNRKRLVFASTVIAHAADGIQQNGPMFIGIVTIMIMFALHAFAFISFISQYVYITEIQEVTVEEYIEEEGDGNGDGDRDGNGDDWNGNSNWPNWVSTGTKSDCQFRDPAWKINYLWIFLFTWMWSTKWYDSARLSIIATTIGSWHWHPENKPSIGEAIKIPFTTSLGTVSLSSLLVAIVDQIRRNSKFRWWYVCSPWHLALAIVGWCLVTCMEMLTKFTLVIHCFTGQAFFPSAKNCFGLMSRHFKNGMVTEAASKNVMNIASFLFSMVMFFVCWAWLDAEFGQDKFTTLTGEAMFFVWLFVQAFLLWYPTIGILIICMIDTLVKAFNDKENSTVPVVMASMFVGLISVMLFNYMGSVILDTIDVCFVCFAVDKDNNVDLSQSVFAQQICKNMSELKEGVIVGGVEGFQPQQAMTAQTVAVGQPVAQQVGAPGEPMMGVPGTLVQGADGQMMMMVAAPPPQQAL